MRRLVSLAAVVTLGFGLAPSAGRADQSGLRESLDKLVTPEPTPQQEIALYGAISRRPMSDNDVIVPWLREHLASLHAVFVFELARRQFESDRDAALESFVMGEVRFTYDGLRCGDPPEDAVALAVIERYFSPIPEYLRAHPREHADALRRAKDRPDLFAPGVSPTRGDDDDPKPRAEWAPIEEKLRKGLADAAREFETEVPEPPPK